MKVASLILVGLSVCSGSILISKGLVIVGVSLVAGLCYMSGGLMGGALCHDEMEAKCERQ